MAKSSSSPLKFHPLLHYKQLAVFPLHLLATLVVLIDWHCLHAFAEHSHTFAHARQSDHTYVEMYRRSLATNKDVMTSGNSKSFGGLNLHSLAYQSLARNGVAKSASTGALNVKKSTVGTGMNVRAAEARTTAREEVEALTAFKAAIIKDKMGVLADWHENDSTACGWAGITCDTRLNHSDHVVALNLRDSGLVGNLNFSLRALCRLRSLRRLDLSVNFFTGSMPRPGNGLENCSSLSYLNISDNLVSGTIPSQVQVLTNLEILDLQRNNLTGEIPPSLANCSLLRVLNLASNFLEGHIPAAFGRISKLEALVLGDSSLYRGKYYIHALGLQASNNFVGGIPLSLGNCSSLTLLNLGSNPNLGGELPQSLGQLRNLQHLYVDYCDLSGVLPAWLGNLTSLRTIAVDTNSFHGEIPEAIGHLQKLSDFSLSWNNFTGVIVPAVGNLSSLLELKLEHNDLSGDIPTQLGSLSSLKRMQLWENRFTGILPSSISNCSSLEELSAGNNPFMDPQTFPTWVASFQNLWSLELQNMNLRGEIPREIGRLSKLERLFLYSNANLTGTIPPSLGNCSSMDNIEIAFTQVTGAIPPELGSLTKLRFLIITGNHLSGTLPASLTNLTQLQELAPDGNLLSGEINLDWAKLSQLQYFLVGNNRFQGPIPRSLCNCSTLVQVGLFENSLTGQIPSALGNVTSLTSLDFAENLIDGQIPAELERCTALEYLDLSSNNLGNILPNIGQLSSLAFLNLSKNELVGDVPASLGNCSQIAVMDLSYNLLTGSVPGYNFAEILSLRSCNLSHNYLSGSWPRGMNQLSNIEEIDLSANNISGSVPDQSLDDWPLLTKLDISVNNLTGAIPKFLGSLPALKFFNASYNFFEGPIPDTGIFKSNLTKAAFLGNPGLCGAILGSGRQCFNSTGTPSASSRDSCQGFKCKRVWIPVACAGIGLVCISGGLLMLGWVYTVTARRGLKDDSNLIVWDGRVTSLGLSPKDILGIIHEDHDSVIGGGGQSIVYKGVFSNGEMFAVKTLRWVNDSNANSSDGGEYRKDKEAQSKLLQEVEILAQLRHRNVLKVLGFFRSKDVTASILEYMPQGSLHSHLHPPERATCELSWQARFSIAVGVAEGMKYLHHDFPDPLIHGDLKPSNILLDADFNAKIADFGVSKFANPLKDGEATASVVRGTIGYIPPEYAQGTSISTKGDVYSYGIVLLELMTGRPPVSADGVGASYSNRGWMLKLFQETHSAMQLLDETLKHEGVTDSLKYKQMMLLIRVGLLVTRETPEERPSTIDVLSMLEQIKCIGQDPIPRRTIADLAMDPDTETCASETQDRNDAAEPAMIVSY